MALRPYIITQIVLANMLFCLQIYYIFMINAHLLQKFVVPIYTFFPPILLCLKVDHRQFDFRMYAQYIYVHYAPQRAKRHGQFLCKL